ncbi:hypothetical protein H0H93_008408 [Arthromyces matolae]|nr:hypothetical protein H0H93_008408 [Arthromyces matolae]
MTRSSRVDPSRQRAEHSKDPSQSKQDTDNYLEYYQSAVADGQVDETDQESSSHGLKRAVSVASTSSSDYSDDYAIDVPQTAPLHVSAKARRRSKAPSNGSSDRRRLAIVQMDPSENARPKKSKDDHSRSTSIRTRRGVTSDLAGIALVAPPDAAPTSYTHLTPPTTTPSTTQPPDQNTTRSSAHSVRPSDILTTGNATREISAMDQMTVASKPSQVEPRIIVEGNAMSLPGDQHTKPSQSPSPSMRSGASDQAHQLLSPTSHAATGITRENTPNSLITTPEIGEGKDISARVAAPVIISLESAGPFTRKKASLPRNDLVMYPATASATSFPSQDKSSYLHYEPGVHATAGPVPTLPPPRAMFNIDVTSPAPPRPPRHTPSRTANRTDIEAAKKSLQLPPSVTAALASKPPKSDARHYVEALEGKAVPPQDSRPEVEEVPTNTATLSHVKSAHRREGALVPSPSTSIMTTSDVPISQTSTKQPSDDGHSYADNIVDEPTSSIDHNISSNDTPPITIIQPMQVIEEQEDQDIITDAMSDPTRRPTSDDLSARSRSKSPIYSRRAGDTPSPPPKSFRNSWTANLKRLSSSLPRTPSLSSKSHRSSVTYHSSRTPSPPMQSIPLPQPRPKIISAYPPPMFYAEISTRKTSLERSKLYAQKINELYLYDSGLGDWTIETRQRMSNTRPAVASSSHTFTPQPRQTSRSSIVSEVSFPRRPDASIATDLTVRPADLATTAPPVLPYPSLANQHMFPARSSSLSSQTPPGSIRSFASSGHSAKSPGGFFASLGRKASMSSSKKPGLPQISTNTSSKVLTKPPPASAAPRVINIATSPIVPGGPRAIPNRRAARSQTLMIAPNSYTPPSSISERNEPLGRRPSLFDLASSPEPAPIVDIAPDPEFVRQVDKLVHLLPDANRDVLAGYLRRAGQDILAIGQYLEDEKNGTIKPP